MSIRTLKISVAEWQSASKVVIAELRAMKLDEAFIAQFIGEGKADSVIRGVIRRHRQKKG